MFLILQEDNCISARLGWHKTLLIVSLDRQQPLTWAWIGTFRTLHRSVSTCGPTLRERERAVRPAGACGLISVPQAIALLAAAITPPEAPSKQDKN
jgi:hypothetical protein